MKILTSFLFVVALAACWSHAGAQVYINEYCSDPIDTSLGPTGLDTNGDGIPATSSFQFDDEFVEIVNAGPAAVDISGWKLLDGALGGTVRHVFAAGTSLPVGAAIVVFGGGSVTNFNAAGAGLGVTASTGSLTLGNGGDTVELQDANGVTVDIHIYLGGGGPDDGDGFSVTRNPEGPTGLFNPSPVVAFGVLHSAGFMNDGVTPYAPAVLDPAMYPGNGTDADLELSINGMLDQSNSGVHTALAGDALTLRFFSPNGTLDLQPFAAMLQLVPTGTFLFPQVVPGDPPGGGFWLDTTQAFLIVNGFAPVPLAPVLLPGGFVYGGVIPVVLGGMNMSLMLQFVCVDPGRNSFNLGIATAREVVVP